MTTALHNGIRKVAARLAPESATDGQLLLRFLDERDEAAFAAIVRRHGAMVLGTCRRVAGNRADADDAFQATFIVLARRASAFADRACVGNFLYGVAYHSALKARAMAATRRRREAKALREAPAAHDPELLRCLDEELAKLPEKYREPVVMCELEGAGRREAASRLGIPEGTVSSRLATAHRMLEKRLKSRGFAAVVAASILTNQARTAPVELAEATVQAAIAGPSSGVAHLVSEVSKMMFLSKLKTGAFLVSVALVVLGGGSVLIPGGGTAAGEEKTKVKEVTVSADTLVKRLGSGSFQERKDAQKSLRALGRAAIPAIKQGLKSDSPEVVRRSEKLIEGIHKDFLERFTAKASDFESPVWKRFKGIAGDGADSRKLFAEMIADFDRFDRLEDVEPNGKKAFELCRSEVERIDAAWTKSFEGAVAQPVKLDGDRSDMRSRSKGIVSHEDVLQFLFLGSKSVPEKDRVAIAKTILNHSAFIELAGGNEMEPLRKLFIAWLKNQTESALIHKGLRSAMLTGISDAADIAREILRDGKQPPAVLGEALLAVGNLGNEKDLPLLAKYKSDERTYSKSQEPMPNTLQLRDAAAGMSLHLLKEDINNYDFNSIDYYAWYVGDKKAPFNSLMFFNKPADRDTALAKAWKWLEARPDPNAKPAEKK